MSYQEVEKEIERVAKLRQDNDEKSAQEDNDEPCAVCGSEKFVQKFRNVVGKISGSMHGYFSLFGGSVSGHIDGYTETLPVLSCRECENERKIATWKYVNREKVFWDFMHDFYFGIEDDDENDLRSIDPFFLERPLGTMEYMLENPNYKYDFYNALAEYDTTTWAEAGFKIPKVKKRFLFWEWERYATWEELVK